MTAKHKTLYKNVFNTVEGKKVLRDLMDFCHFTNPTYDPNNIHNSAFNEGKRRVLLRIISFMSDNEALEVYRNNTNKINHEVDII